MSGDPTAEEIRRDVVDTVHEWLPKYPGHAPGWALVLIASDREAGELRYELRPYAPVLSDGPTYQYRVTITVEQEAPRG